MEREHFYLSTRSQLPSEMVRVKWFTQKYKCVKSTERCNRKNQCYHMREFPIHLGKNKNWHLQFGKAWSTWFILNYHAQFPELSRSWCLKIKQWQQVVRHVKSIYSHHEILTPVVTSTGLQFSGKEFLDFAQMYYFHYETSRFRYSYANITVKCGILILKKLHQNNGGMRRYINTSQL